MSILIGEIAAIATSLLWAVSSTFFTIGGKGHSPHSVNKMRLLGALFLLGISHMIFLNTFLPDENLYIWLLLGLSGIVGLAIGDGFLLFAYTRVGPRISMLIMSMAPIVTVTAGWVVWGERLSFIKLIAIALILSGVSYVVLEKKVDRSPFKITWIGLALAIGAMLGQATQILLAKDAMDHMNSSNVPLTAAYIRIIWGAIAVWIASVFIKRKMGTLKAIKDRRFVIYIGLATIVGPFLGIWVSFIAVDNVDIGIASTLMSVSPLMIIPISWKVFNEKITIRAISGTIIAMIGVAGLFLL